LAISLNLISGLLFLHLFIRFLKCESETFQRYQCKAPGQLVPDQLRASQQASQKKADDEVGFLKINAINSLWPAT
jgi:hypothetical protein